MKGCRKTEQETPMLYIFSLHLLFDIKERNKIDVNMALRKMKYVLLQVRNT